MAMSPPIETHKPNAQSRGSWHDDQHWSCVWNGSKRRCSAVTTLHSEWGQGSKNWVAFPAQHRAR